MMTPNPRSLGDNFPDDPRSLGDEPETGSSSGSIEDEQKTQKTVRSTQADAPSTSGDTQGFQDPMTEEDTASGGPADPPSPEQPGQ